MATKEFKITTTKLRKFPVEAKDDKEAAKKAEKN